jgi:hypothetical protein
MTEITSMNANKWTRHFHRRIVTMSHKKWIVAGAILALLYVAWTRPLESSLAQTPPAPVPVLVAGPVAIKGSPRTPSVAVSPGERAVLMVTNVGDEPILVRMAFRDATDFGRILASTERTLQPGAGEILPFIEQDNAFRTLIAVVSPGGRGNNDWSSSTWNGSFRAVLANLFVVDDATNTTKFVVGTDIVAIRSGGEPTVGQR